MQVFWCSRGMSGQSFPIGCSNYGMGESPGKVIPLGADFENDLDTEYTFYLTSSNPAYQSNFRAFGSAPFLPMTLIFGLNTDDPTVIGDYTGDGKADIAVFRCNPNDPVGTQCYWIYRFSEFGIISVVPWGVVYAPGKADIAAPGDYDGDGKLDFAVRRLTNPNDPNSQVIFYILRSTDGGFEYHLFGVGTDRFVSGDFDGDGKTDLCAVRNTQVQGAQLNWFIRYSTTGSYATFIPWGLGKSGQIGDYIAPGDYTGDGRTDLAVWRRTSVNETTVFYILPSTAMAGNFGSIIYEQFAPCTPGPCEYPVAQYLVH